MNHRIVGITSVKVTAPFTLALHFDDDTRRTVDLSGVLEGEMYGPLRDPAMFNRVAIDPDFATVIWPNGADFDPAILHDWPEHEAAFKDAAARWAGA